MSNLQQKTGSAATEALLVAGDATQAADVAALEAAQSGAQQKLGTTRVSLVERMLYGPQPSVHELASGAVHMLASGHPGSDRILEKAMACLASGEAFTADGKISDQLRSAVAADKSYGFTVPAQFGGLGLNYSQLACLEEQLAANGLGSLAVEISGQLTIGSSSLLGYGTDAQRSTFLPLIADGELIAFALTEVGVGANAKRVQAWVEHDEHHQCWRLNADGAANKLYITSATHGGLAAIVARKGCDSREIGLFVVQLPEEDVHGDFHFECHPSNTSAFAQNINSRLRFSNFPIPFEHEIQGNGIEVLFYCLRMGRCMLAAMSAGFQRMMAADAALYARQREGVGGKVAKHELPRLGLARILGGALTAQSLSHLSLSQDAAGVDLAGLRDLTKSASAKALLESLIACERVLGGRSLDNGSRITEARATIHAFGIVEGEDDLIRLGMVKDVTARFTEKYMAGLLGVLRNVNQRGDGSAVDAGKRIDRLSIASFLKYPGRSIKACLLLAVQPGFWRLLAWVLMQLVRDLIRLPNLLIPASLQSRYRDVPRALRRYVSIAERGLRRCRWTYLGLNLIYQLELTRAQIPMQRLGKRIELLMSMAAVCAHASKLDDSQQRIARFQSERILEELKGLRLLSALGAIDRLRQSVNDIAGDINSENCSLISGVEPQSFAHPWED